MTKKSTTKGRSNLAPCVPLTISLTPYIYVKVINIFSSSVSQPHVNVKDAMITHCGVQKCNWNTPMTI